MRFRKHGRTNANANAVFRVIFSNRQQFDYIAKLFSIIDILDTNVLDAFDLHIIKRHASIECNGSQDYSFTSSVQTANVSSWVGFCVTHCLCFFQNFIIVHMLLGHFGKHIVGSTIYDTHNGREFICSQRGFHGLQNGNTTCNTSFKHKVAFSSFCQWEKFCSVFCQYVFVSSYNTFTIFKSFRDKIFSRVFPTQ